MTTSAAERLHWTNIFFLAGAHVLAAAGVVWLATSFSWWTLGLAFLWWVLSSLSITGGYHRLFAHRAYRASAWLRGFYLLFGAAGVQNSALLWSGDHRRHHSWTDTERDPYNARRGLWWSHVGWILRQGDRSENAARVKDLQADRLVALQHRFYLPLAVFMGAVLPMLLGLLWGDPVGGLLVAGFLRLVVQWHMTFSINSFAHRVGVPRFDPESTARDSWLIAIFTMGEGYHSFHHRFQADYRNGHRWFHFDPTKWTLWALSKVRATSNLRRTPRSRIARAAAQARRRRREAPLASLRGGVPSAR